MKTGIIILIVVAIAFVVFAALNGWRMVGDGNMVNSNTVKRFSGGKPTMSMPPPDAVRPAEIPPPEKGAP